METEQLISQETKNNQIVKKTFFLFLGTGAIGAFLLLINVLLSAFKPSLFKSLGAIKVIKVWIFNVLFFLTISALFFWIFKSEKTLLNKYMLAPIVPFTLLCTALIYYFNLELTNFWHYVAIPFASLVIIFLFAKCACDINPDKPIPIFVSVSAVAAIIEKNIFYPTVDYLKMLAWFALASFSITASGVVMSIPIKGCMDNKNIYYAHNIFSESSTQTGTSLQQGSTITHQ